MKDRKADLIVENGGGNQMEIFKLIVDLFHFEPPDPAKVNVRVEAEVDAYHARNIERRNLMNQLTELDCDRFYMADGSKVTKSIKPLLLKQFGKETVAKHFAEFCKRVGNIYVHVNATTELHDVYFDERSETYGDYGSCFFPCGCNRQHGKFIDLSPCTGVITIDPDTLYAPGRMIVWFKDSTTAHLINKYSAQKGRELPHSIFARALEMLTDTEVTWHRDTNRDDRDTICVYLNNNPLVCTVKGKKNFSSIIKDHRFYCTVCTELYTNTDPKPSTFCDDCMDNGTVRCTACGGRENGDDTAYVDDEPYCQECYGARFFYCEWCENDCDRENSVMSYYGEGRRNYPICRDCAERDFFNCKHCDAWVVEENAITLVDGSHYCVVCSRGRTKQCSKCSEYWDKQLDEFDEDEQCPGCQSSKKKGGSK